MTRLEAQIKTRTQNARYLTSMLREIPGIAPARQYAGCTNNAYHLYMLRYDPAAFSGLSRDNFLKALAAEGVPASTGYSPLNTQEFLKAALESRGYKRLYSARASSNGMNTTSARGTTSFAARPSGSRRICSSAPATIWNRSSRPSAKSKSTLETF